MEKRNSKIYKTLSVFGTLSLILIVFFVWPAFKGIEKSSQNLISAKINLVTLDAQINEAENFKKNYDSYKPNLDKMDQLFVDPKNPVDFIEFLENTALSCQITSQAFLPSPSIGSKSASQDFIILQIVSKGSFSDVLNFLKKIETGIYLVEVKNLTIKNLETKNTEAAFTIKAFTKK